MRELEAAGSAQCRKIYARHGAPVGNVFGVKFADINRIAKAIKRDHELARRLWRGGNYDARNLAVKVADPSAMDAAELQEWVADVDNYMHAGFVGQLGALSPAALEVLEGWTLSEAEFVRNAGYSLLGSLVKERPELLGDDGGAAFLVRIEAEIHSSPNWARYGMNWALIAVGTYKEGLTEAAVAAAERIGAVDVDHGETSCKTPAAGPYIRKAVAHIRDREARRAAKSARSAPPARRDGVQ